MGDGSPLEAAALPVWWAAAESARSTSSSRPAAAATAFATRRGSPPSTSSRVIHSTATRNFHGNAIITRKVQIFIRVRLEKRIFAITFTRKVLTARKTPAKWSREERKSKFFRVFFVEESAVFTHARADDRRVSSRSWTQLNVPNIFACTLNCMQIDVSALASASIEIIKHSDACLVQKHSSRDYLRSRRSHCTAALRRNFHLCLFH